MTKSKYSALFEKVLEQPNGIKFKTTIDELANIKSGISKLKKKFNDEINSLTGLISPEEVEEQLIKGHFSYDIIDKDDTYNVTIELKLAEEENDSPNFEILD